MKGVFAWITCPKVLNKFMEEMALSGVNLGFKKTPEELTVSSDHLVVQDQTIVLEEYAFKVHQKDKNCQQFSKWLADNLFAENNYWKDKIQNDIVVLKDEEFTDFVNLSTEVITRTKINNETGTVQDGALFTEEFLPTESILYSLILASPEFGKKAKSFADEKEVIECFDNSINEKIENVFQLGGNATLGKGIMRAIFLNENQPANQEMEKNHCPRHSQSFDAYFNRYSSFLTGGDQNAKTQ
jgi:CRISPR-associated protein Cmr4